MLRETAAFRAGPYEGRSYGLDEPVSAEVDAAREARLERVARWWPGTRCGHTTDGSPVQIFNLGRVDPVEMAELEEHDIIEFYTRWMDRSLELQNVASASRESWRGMVEIYDVEELSMWQLSHASAMSMLTNVLQIGQRHYPESLRLCFLVNSGARRRRRRPRALDPPGGLLARAVPPPCSRAPHASSTHAHPSSPLRSQASFSRAPGRFARACSPSGPSPRRASRATTAAMSSGICLGETRLCSASSRAGGPRPAEGAPRRRESAERELRRPIQASERSRCMWHRPRAVHRQRGGRDGREGWPWRAGGEVRGGRGRGPSWSASGGNTAAGGFT